jgi:hypothetical protein
LDEGDDDLILPNDVVTDYLARAKDAFRHLGKTYEYHIQNGWPIFEFKKQLGATIRPNDPDQRAEDTQRWRDSMSEFLRVNHFHEDDPEAPWTKAERVNLMHIMERIEEVEEFRRYYSETYGSKKLRRLNNPSAVLDKFLTWKGEKKKKAGKPTKQDETVRLVNILDSCCDHLHVGKGGEYTELKERIERFDGTNFVGVSTEGQQIEAGKWHAENERLSGELEKATQAVMNTTGELERVKGQRERQASTLMRALDLLKAITTQPDDADALQQSKTFLGEMFPENPWSDDWNQRQKTREERLAAIDQNMQAMQQAVDGATASVGISQETPQASEPSEPVSDGHCPKCGHIMQDACFNASDGGTFKICCCSQCDGPPTEEQRDTAHREYHRSKKRYVGAVILRGLLEGNAVPEIGSIVADPWTMEWVSDNSGLPGEKTWTVLVWTGEGWRVHFQSESVIKAGMERQCEKERQLQAKRAARKERKASSPAAPAESADEGLKGEPSVPADTPEDQDALVREVRNYIREFLRQHPRLDRALDESFANVIQRELQENDIAEVGITVLKKMIADLAPLPRGRKPKIQQTVPAETSRATNDAIQ